MRLIKFRAWDKDHLKSRVDSVRANGMIYFGLKDYAYDQDGEMGSCDIDIETMPIMQFTGLHDKNGKEIWEGDIVRVFTNPSELEEKVEVFYNTKFLRFSFGGLITGYYDMEDIDLKNIEVLGNIYSNPELLKEPNDKA